MELNLQKIAEDNIRVNALLNAGIHDVHEQIKNDSGEIAGKFKNLTDELNEASKNVIVKLQRDIDKSNGMQKIYAEETQRQLAKLQSGIQTETAKAERELALAVAQSQQRLTELLRDQVNLSNSIYEKSVGMMTRLSDVQNVQNRLHKRLLIAAVVMGCVNTVILIILLALR